jgi:hypothetical protein
MTDLLALAENPDVDARAEYRLPAGVERVALELFLLT